LTQYAAAFVTVAIATLCSLALEQVIVRIPFALFFAAVTASAWYGGLGPGLLAAGLGILAVDYFILPPKYVLAPTTADDFVALAVLTLVAVMISSITARLGKARARAEAAEAAERRQR
jgi:K+-sensing histidine kinase KdpD